jgi:AAA domain-containing protein
MAGPRTIPRAPSPNIENGASEAPEPLRGASLLDLANMEVPSDKTLLGKRWLCIGGGAIIVGPSGIGKSTLSIQAAALWACGCTAFGIKPARPLRVLIVQAEDDEGDSIEMAKMIELLGINDQQRQLVGQNTHLEFLNDKTGVKFTERLEEMLGLFPADMVITNPLSAYLGDDTKDEKSVNQFLRNWINPILTRRQAAVIFVHHTPKTINRHTSDWEATEWMYSVSGVAGITNWSRAYIAIDSTKTHGVFRFIAAKRGQRIGWGGFETFWAHSQDDGKILWVPANRDQIAMAKKAAKKSPDDLLTIIPELDPISQAQFFLDASKHGIGRDRARDFVDILIDQKKAFVWKLPRANTKSAIGYAQRAQPEEE